MLLVGEVSDCDWSLRSDQGTFHYLTVIAITNCPWRQHVGLMFGCWVVWLTLAQWKAVQSGAGCCRCRVEAVWRTARGVGGGLGGVPDILFNLSQLRLTAGGSHWLRSYQWRHWMHQKWRDSGSSGEWVPLRVIEDETGSLDWLTSDIPGFSRWDHK